MHHALPQLGKWLSTSGPDTVFAFPGQQADPWILAVESAGARVVCASSETAAGYMANGLAQLTCAPSVVIVGGGPALAMLVPAVQSAVAEGLPVLTLVGQSDGAGFPPTDQNGTRDHALLNAVFAGAVIHAADYNAVPEALNSANRFLECGRPVAVTVPVQHPTAQHPTPTRLVDDRFDPNLADRHNFTVSATDSSSGTVSYHAVVRAALAAAGERSPLFVDAGQARHAARMVLPEGSFFDAPRTAPMGSGMCAAIGTAIAQRRRTYAVVGDGSALMFVAELATAARYRAAATIVVCVNGVLGSPYARTSRHGSQTSLLGPLDWAGIAEAFGIEWSAAGDHAALLTELTSTGEGCRMVCVPTPKIDPSLTSPLPSTRAARC
jgi:thiamine pyrophosphate-dependent acetolactate synthase large subunit-like protein